MQLENKISYEIIGACYEVHSRLGPGMLESTYQKCLLFELNELGYKTESEVFLPVTYKNMHIDHAYKADIIVNQKVIIELKAVEAFSDAHSAQLLTYLKMSNLRLGLLLNFNVKSMKHGIKRIINSKATPK